MNCKFLAGSIILLTIGASTSFSVGNASGTIGEVVRNDPRLDKLIAPGTQIEVLADGFDWSEGPVWISDPGYVVFSDVPVNKIFKWSEGEGISVFLEPSG